MEPVLGESADGGGVVVQGADGTLRVVPAATPMRDVPSPIGQLGQPGMSRLTPDELSVLANYMDQPGPAPPRQPVMLEEQRIAPSPGWAQEITDAEMQVLAPLAGGATLLPQQPVSAGEVMAQAQGLPPVIGAMIPDIPVDTGPAPLSPPPPTARFGAVPVAGDPPGQKPEDVPAQPAAPAQAARASAQPSMRGADIDLPEGSRDVRRARLENVARYNGLDGEVRDGIMDAAGNVAQYSGDEMEAYARVADVYRQQADLERRAAEVERDRAKRVDEQMETLLGVQRETRVDMPARNTGGFILDVLSAALGGFASGILGTENTALAAIRARIENQLEVQRDNAELAQRNVDAQTREALRQAGVSASEADMRQAGRALALEEAATEVRRYAAGVDNEEVRARMLALAGNVSGEATQIREGIYRSLEDGMRRDERIRSGGSRPSGRIPGVRVVDPVTGETTFVDVFSYGSGGNFRDAREALAARTAAANGVAGNISTMSGVERAESPRPEAARPDDWFRPRNLTRDPSVPPAPERVLREILEADNALSNWSDGVTRLKELTRNGANFASPEGRAAVGALAGVMRTRFGTRIYQSALQTHEMEDLDNILSHPNDITPAVMQTWLPRMNEITRLMRREVNALGESAGYRPAGVDRRQRPMGEVLQESGASSGQRLPPGVRPLRR